VESGVATHDTTRSTSQIISEGQRICRGVDIDANPRPSELFQFSYYAQDSETERQGT
jgi:hypothetical protein